jgi:tripartite-type tricarboxylate transporter receptor subunit TctC
VERNSQSKSGVYAALIKQTQRQRGLRPARIVSGYEAISWFGVGAPKNTPAEIVNKLNKEINAALSDPKMKARLGDLGGTVLVGSPAQFGRLIADETEKWGKVIRAANIKPE